MKKRIISVAFSYLIIQCVIMGCLPGDVGQPSIWEFNTSFEDISGDTSVHETEFLDNNLTVQVETKAHLWVRPLKDFVSITTVIRVIPKSETLQVSLFPDSMKVWFDNKALQLSYNDSSSDSVVNKGMLLQVVFTENENEPRSKSVYDVYSEEILKCKIKIDLSGVIYANGSFLKTDTLFATLKRKPAVMAN